MASKTGRATIQREADNGYSVAIFSHTGNEADEEQLEFSAPDLTLTNAFNSARDALGPMAVGAEKHQKITITTRIK